VRSDYKWFLLGLVVVGGFLGVEQVLLRVTSAIIASAIAAVTGCMVLLVFVRWIVSERTTDPSSLPPQAQVSQPDTVAPPILVAPAPAPPLPVDRDSRAASSPTVLDVTGPGFHGAVLQFKRQLLAKAIASSAGNRAEAARLLGLQRTYLYRLTRQLGIDRGKDEPTDSAEESAAEEI
jgi:hypothetical protein